MAAPMTAAMPPATALDNGCTVEFVALDPTTGAAVAGVTVSNISIYVDSAGGVSDLAFGPFLPVLIPTRQT